MERNGIDSYRLHPLFGSWVEVPFSPIFSDLQEFAGSGEDSQQRSAEFIRRLHLQLRNHYRNEFGLDGLTPDEWASWPPPPPRRPDDFTSNWVRQAGDCAAPVHVITELEAQEIASYVLRHFPEEVAYQRALSQLAVEQGYVPPNDVGRTGFVEDAIIGSAKVVTGKRHIGHAQLVKPLLTMN